MRTQLKDPNKLSATHIFKKSEVAHREIHIHPSATTRLKNLFSFVVCNRKPYDVIFIYHVIMLELLIRGFLFGDVINIIFMKI